VYLYEVYTVYVVFPIYAAARASARYVYYFFFWDRLGFQKCVDARYALVSMVRVFATFKKISQGC
jgi:hypothetical protein